MANYTIMHLSYIGVFRWFFCSGICFGGLIGIILGLLERSLTGILNGMFFGFIFGLLSGLFGVTYAAVFNILSPYTGGIPVELKSLDEESGAENRSAINQADL